MNVSEELIREIVQKVLEESTAKQAPAEDFVKEKDPSGIIKIATETVKCERFEQDGVALKDVVTLEAVSYTHLDVYKRQVSGRTSAERRGLP